MTGQWLTMACLIWIMGDTAVGEIGVMTGIWGADRTQNRGCSGTKVVASCYRYFISEICFRSSQSSPCHY